MRTHEDKYGPALPPVDKQEDLRKMLWGPEYKERESRSAYLLSLIERQQARQQPRASNKDQQYPRELIDSASRGRGSNLGRNDFARISQRVARASALENSQDCALGSRRRREASLAEASTRAHSEAAAGSTRSQ
jgi:hypothetical protein